MLNKAITFSGLEMAGGGWERLKLGVLCVLCVLCVVEVIEARLEWTDDWTLDIEVWTEVTEVIEVS